MRKNKDFIDLLHKVSEAELTILLSAIKKRGVFCKGYDVLSDNKGIILFDGNFLYPLGEINIGRHIKLIEKMAFCGVLGSPKNVGKILKIINKENWTIMKKDFAILKRREQFSNNLLPDDTRIECVKNKDELKQFCNLKIKFLFEESGQMIDPKILYNFLENCYSIFFPVLLLYKNKAVGMISSDFSSDKLSMINMFFIEKNFRGHGYGQILLEWYVKYLLKSSKNVCLYFSPENIAAEKIYKKLGFKKTDEWLTALEDKN